MSMNLSVTIGALLFFFFIYLSGNSFDLTDAESIKTCIHTNMHPILILLIVSLFLI